MYSYPLLFIILIIFHYSVISYHIKSSHTGETREKHGKNSLKPRENLSFPFSRHHSYKPKISFGLIHQILTNNFNCTKKAFLKKFNRIFIKLNFRINKKNPCSSQTLIVFLQRKQTKKRAQLMADFLLNTPPLNNYICVLLKNQSQEATIFSVYTPIKLSFFAKQSPIFVNKNLFFGSHLPHLKPLKQSLIGHSARI